MRPPRRAIPTRPGLFALVAPLILGLAGVTAGNNLLFILLGATLGTIILSGVLSERAIQGIRVSARPLGPLRAGEEGRLWVGLERSGGPRIFGVEVLEVVGSSNLWGRVPPGHLHARVSVFHGQRTEAVASRRFHRRGALALPPCEVVTTYPFGLLRKARDIEVRTTGAVWPRRVELPTILRRRLAAAVEGSGGDERGTGTDFFGVRERRGDEAGRLHARRSARLGRDVIVETAREEQPVAWVGVDHGATADPEALERCLELAGAWLTTLAEQGRPVGLVTLDGALGPEPLERLLDRLARVEPVERSRGDARSVVWLVPEGASAQPGDVVVDRTGAIRTVEAAA
jgi:uncharacterized protein (DUF58 family)